MPSFISFSETENMSEAASAGLDKSEAGKGNTRLAEECAKLDPAAEQAMAEEGLDQKTMP